MSMYPFACPSCSAEFDVERAEGDHTRTVACPVDGAPARRVYGVAPLRGGARLQSVPTGSFWHDHGPGTEPHLHGVEAARFPHGSVARGFAS